VIGHHLGTVNRSSNLHDDPACCSVEVDDKGADWLLTAKLYSVEPLPSERGPKRAFANRWLLPKVSGNLHHLPP
jgi:hypothetical protein